MVWDRLQAAWHRFRRPRRRIMLEVTPEEQLVLQFLFRYGAGSEEDLVQEVAAHRWTHPHSVRTSLLNLRLKGLVSSAGHDPVRGARYRPTERSCQLRDLLPDHPTSSLVVYLTVTVDPPARTPPER
ncbi:MAG: hypothetical protein HY689_08625 [Chloroflexi bacterium]|nr:hypothetical protein [Chloroflexota bacterium]